MTSHTKNGIKRSYMLGGNSYPANSTEIKYVRPLSGGYGEENSSYGDTSKIPIHLDSLDTSTILPEDTSDGRPVGVIPRVTSIQVKMTIPDLNDWKSTIEDIAGANILEVIDLDANNIVTDSVLESSSSTTSILLQLNFDSKINIENIKEAIQKKSPDLDRVLQIAEPKNGKSVKDTDVFVNSQTRIITNNILKKLNVIIDEINPIKSTLVTALSSIETMSGSSVRVRAPSQEVLLNNISSIETALHTTIKSIKVNGLQIYPLQTSRISISGSNPSGSNPSGSTKGGGDDIYTIYFTDPSINTATISQVLSNPTYVSAGILVVDTTSAPSVSSTTPSISSTKPPVSSTTPPVSSTTPPVSSTTPPVSSTTHSVSDTTPPVSDTTPTVSDTTTPTGVPGGLTGPCTVNPGAIAALPQSEIDAYNQRCGTSITAATADGSVTTTTTTTTTPTTTTPTTTPTTTTTTPTTTPMSQEAAYQAQLDKQEADALAALGLGGGTRNKRRRRTNRKQRAKRTGTYRYYRKRA